MPIGRDTAPKTEIKRLTMRIANDVLAALSCAETQGNQLKLTGQLDRTLYTRVNKVLEAAGGKWNRKLKAHVFDDEAATRVDQIILSGEVIVPKNDFEFFPTPPEVVSCLIAAADIGDSMLVLEPSAGRGAIALPASQAAKDVMVDMYDLMRENIDTLISLHIPGSGVADACDFLTVEPRPVYDRVVMNPPFSKQADIKHVLHAHKFLKPGGLLIAVMSAGVTFRENSLTVDFRGKVEARRGYLEHLPEGSFKQSGTMVNTVMAVIPA